MENKVNEHHYTPENIALLIATNVRLSEENLQLKTNLEAAEKKLAWLIEQVKLSRHRQFSQQNEKSKYLDLQLELAFDEAGDEEDNSGEEAKSEELVATETITYSRKKKSVGRRIDTSKLLREVVTHDLSEAEKRCDKCGSQLEKFGEDRSEQLEYIPAQVKVIEHISPKYTCRCCETVKTGAKPEVPIAKSMAAPSLIAEVIIKKFEHHLPWYRQSKIFTQDGLDIPANTIGNWFMEAGEVLEPLSIALKNEVNNTNNLQADETPVKVLKNNHRGYMWGYHSLKPNNRFILFEYNESRSGKVASDNLKNYRGILQTDGYGGYNNLRIKDDIIAIGCWAHCRRHFTDVIKIAISNGKAHEIVKWIGKLYQIEDKAREQNLSFAARKDLRQSHAPPILQKIHELLTKSIPPPKSVLGKAMAYALNHWEYLIKYVDHGEAEIDTNLIENQIRPFAVSRKNWLFLGNEKAAHTAALFYSLIQTCRLNNLDPKKYLIYILYQAGRMRRNEINPSSLLPQFIDKALLD